MKVSRRSFLGSAGAGAGIALTGASGRPVARPKAVVCDLKASQLVDPIGIEDRLPVLSWCVEGVIADLSAYRVRVATSEALLRGDRPDLWDSGWQSDADATSAVYAGLPLLSRQRCFWTVALRGTDRGVFDSAIAVFELGLLDRSDWSATWVAAEDELERDDRAHPPVWVSGSAKTDKPRLFRLAFESGAGDALVTIIADGNLNSLFLDGKPLALPAPVPNAFGGPPAARILVPVSAGAHILSADITAVPGYFTKPEVAVAAQVRLTGPSSVVRISGGWTTSLVATANWRSAGTSSEGWAPATVKKEQPTFPWPATPGRLMRRRFTLAATPRSARVYVTALGGYQLWINGRRVDEDALAPEQSDFERHIPYRTHDVTGHLRPGDNVIAAMIADGFYASYISPVGRYSFGAAPRCLLLQLEAMVGPERITLASDGEWRAATSPLRYGEIYGGEDWDDKFDQAGWTDVGFDDAGWTKTWQAPEPASRLIARIVPPVQETRELAPVSIVKRADDRFIVDFGQNFAGRVRIKVPGGRSDVRVRHAELLDAEGELDRRNLRAARAEDNYRRRADAGAATLQPQFTYHGFRYAEIAGVRDLQRRDVTGLAVSSALKETGMLAVEQPLIQKIWTNTLWSQRSNFVGVPTDCPQRDERLGWTGDAQVFWDTAAFNMDVGAFTRGWLAELRAAQSETGGYPLWAPLPRAASWTPQSTPGWADAGVMLPYISYLRYGDRTVVDENWVAMRAYVDGVLKLNPEGVWSRERGADFGDWLSVDAKSPADETTPKALVATAMLARSVSQLQQMAQWTGRTGDAAALARTHDMIRTAFINAFVRSDGSVGNGSQSGFIFALALDLLPADLRARAAAMLVADIRQRGTALSTGFLGTPLALDALADTGHADVAFDLLLRTDFPSWGHMIRKGATTMWERWNGDTGDLAMNSFNHYAFGAVSGFLYRRVAGIQPVSPGFARTRIAPLLDPRTGRLRCRYQSVRGLIAVDVDHMAAGITVEALVPQGVTADVVLPAGSRSMMTKAVTSKSDPSQVSTTTFSVGPGRHRFRVGERSSATQIKTAI